MTTEPVRGCEYCGGARSESERYCSTGCDLARRLPLGETDLPATWQLGVLLAWLFAFFNQVLFAGFSLLTRSRGEPERAEGFEWISLATGGVFLAVGLAFFVFAKPKRRTDLAGVGGALAVGLGVTWLASVRIEAAHLFGLFALNLLLAIWLTRGLWQRRLSKRA